MTLLCAPSGVEVIMTDLNSESRGVRRRMAAIVAAGVVASAALALSMTGTFSAFVASITNDTNTVGTGALTMLESGAGGTVTCSSTDPGGSGPNQATCSTINKFGGDLALVPGATTSTAVTIQNTGSVAATTFTLTPGTCVQSANGTAPGSATDLCAKLNIVVTSGAATVYSGTLAALATQGAVALPGPVAAGAVVPFTFQVTLDPSADSTYQGLQASLPLTWTFTS